MGHKKRKGISKKKNIQAASLEPEELVRAPHSFIFHRGVVGGYLLRLLRDIRNIMEPFTATNLKARKSNTIKDFVSVAGPLHVSHMVIFTQTEVSPYLRIIKVPRGPTLTFKIHNYILSRDILSTLKKQYSMKTVYWNSPLVVLNGFSGDDQHLKLMVATFQGMFPTINVSTVNLKMVRRCLLFNYNPDTKIIDVRHYLIRVTTLGISKAVKKIVSSKVPDLSRFKDVADFVSKSEILSDSEAEDDPASHVTLPRDITADNLKGSKSAIRLVEIGPRLNLQLIKVEEGVMEGEVMFHEYIQKTEEEKEIIRQRVAEKKKLKEKRRKEQMENIKRKTLEKEEAKKKSLDGMRRAGIISRTEVTDQMLDKDEEDDDREWYRKEVGSEPDPELFSNQKKSILKRKSIDPGMKFSKKFKGLERKNVSFKEDEEKSVLNPSKKTQAGKRPTSLNRRSPVGENRKSGSKNKRRK